MDVCITMRAAGSEATSAYLAPDSLGDGTKTASVCHREGSNLAAQGLMDPMLACHLTVSLAP